jgi:hypothetical protein
MNWTANSLCGLSRGYGFMFLLQGYFLLYESMLDTVLYARDKYLRPETGILLPDKVLSLWVCAIVWDALKDLFL